jgi:hypothetical protein
VIRTEAQRAAWRALDPWRRHLLMSHLPDELEQEANLRASVTTALENVFGPREWSPAAARVAEGEPDPHRPKGDDFAMTHREIGDEIGVSVERVRQIEQKALRKLRHPSRSRQLVEFMYGDVPVVETTAEELDHAIEAAGLTKGVSK